MRLDQELYHEIFGSVLDRTEMTPFLLLPAGNYVAALKQATKMMVNRGFDALDGELGGSERERATRYIQRSYAIIFDGLLPFVAAQLEELTALHSSNESLYRDCLRSLTVAKAMLQDSQFRLLVDEDPRHLLLLASSRRYPHVFSGYGGNSLEVPAAWQQSACCLLKTAHLIKSIEEDSQDINDYVQLAFFFRQRGQRLDTLFDYDWERPVHLPDNEPSQRAFVKISTFFRRLRESLVFDPSKGCLVFNSGDGVDVDIAEIKARLKSPESMVIKLGKNVEGEAYDIRDILAITFILTDIDDTLKLFHALQKRGVILQENTASHSVTQTLFDEPEHMKEAIRRLMISLSRSGGGNLVPQEEQLFAHARIFYEALGKNTEENVHSSRKHRKIQCKIAFSLPIHRATNTNKILIPGTPLYEGRDKIDKTTEQHTLGVELRISDVESWRTSERTGDSHHDAYKFRQLVHVMNRVFKNVFNFPEEGFPQLRRDQTVIFH
ncbi:MAG TPA: hypothetical protein VMT62_05280 [Syntrophorhabdaceae bacterium]|nr:hypothetical protein [Syntrophorhabdaceae bacterium]